MLFTALGTALGATAASAFAVGLGTTAIVAGAGTAAYMMSQGGDDKGTDGMAQMPNAPEAPKMADAQKLAAQRMTDKKRAMAANETIKTNPLGLAEEATVVRKKLLGG